jgi:hypothetical protein
MGEEYIPLCVREEDDKIYSVTLLLACICSVCAGGLD